MGTQAHKISIMIFICIALMAKVAERFCMGQLRVCAPLENCLQLVCPTVSHLFVLVLFAFLKIL